MWTQHIATLVKKLNTNNQMLKMAKHILPQNCLRSIYYSHFLSHLYYGLLTWGGSESKKNINDLYKLQKACIRIIVGNSIRSIEGEFKELKMLTSMDMIRIELSKFGFDISKCVQPKPVQRLMESCSGKKVQRYPTRCKMTPNIRHHKSDLFNKSFLCKSIVEYNKLLNYLKDSKSSEHLAKALKMQLYQT